jgi:hypothetical protein
MSAIQEPFGDPSFNWTTYSKALQDSCSILKKTLKKCSSDIAAGALQASFNEHKALQKTLVKQVIATSPACVPKAFLKELFASQVLLQQASLKNPSLKLECSGCLVSDPTKLTAALEPTSTTRHSNN